jgi:hypothetical protein
MVTCSQCMLARSQNRIMPHCETIHISMENKQCKPINISCEYVTMPREFSIMSGEPLSVFWKIVSVSRDTFMIFPDTCPMARYA